MTKIATVESFSGCSMYNVHLNDGELSCTCLSYRYRRSCKHSDLIGAWLRRLVRLDHHFKITSGGRRLRRTLTSKTAAAA